MDGEIDEGESRRASDDNSGLIDHGSYSTADNVNFNFGEMDRKTSPYKPGSPEPDARHVSVEQISPRDQSRPDSPTSLWKEDGDIAQPERDAVDGNAAADMTWEELENSFMELMDAKRKEEEVLQGEWAKLMEFYSIWAQTPAGHEESRAAKRLRTRIAHVQYQEAELQEKQVHHDRVMQAFKNALDLLS